MTLGRIVFSHSDFNALDNALFADWRYMRCYPGLHYTVYPQHAFRVPDSEQTIRVTRAPKRPGDGGVQFWISAEAADLPLANPEQASKHLRASHFRTIQETEFNSLVRAHCAELIVPPLLPLHESNGFVGALAMHAMETELMLSLFAEYSNEFIHFYWDSTA